LNHRIREGLKRWTASASLSGGARAKLLLRASAAQRIHRMAVFPGEARRTEEAMKLAYRECLVHPFQITFGIFGMLR
jgi:hypothetical protein